MYHVSVICGMMDSECGVNADYQEKCWLAMKIPNMLARLQMLMLLHYSTNISSTLYAKTC